MVGHLKLQWQALQCFVLYTQEVLYAIVKLATLKWPELPFKIKMVNIRIINSRAILSFNVVQAIKPHFIH